MASASQDAFSTELPIEIASTLQAGHIRSNPDPALDMAPGTAADDKEILGEKYDYDALQHKAAHQLDDIDDDEDDIPYSVLRRPRRQRQALPPLPDLRFEQSYLKSIAAADSWWKIALITTRDQVFLFLLSINNYFSLSSHDLVGHHAFSSGDNLQPVALRLAGMESQC